MSNLIFENFVSEISEGSPQRVAPKNGGRIERENVCTRNQAYFRRNIFVREIKQILGGKF